MRTQDISSLLRELRPPASSGWARSKRGRQVLTRVLDASLTRDAKRSDGRRPLSTRVVAAGVALAAALVTAAVLITPQLINDRGVSPLAATDTYHPADAAFFEHLQLGGAVEEAHNYQSLREGTAAATAVVLADVVDVRATRVILGDVPTDQLHMIGVTIRPAEVLAGKLPDQASDTLTVEFPAGSLEPSDKVAQMKQTMPEGRSVWFLVSNAESIESAKATLAERGKTPTPKQLEVWEASEPYYSIINSQGIYIQGETSVLDPIAQPEAGNGGMVRAGQAYSKLSELVNQLRTSR